MPPFFGYKDEVPTTVQGTALMPYTRNFNDWTRNIQYREAWTNQTKVVENGTTTIYWPATRTGERVEKWKSKISSLVQAGSPFSTTRYTHYVKSVAQGQYEGYDYKLPTPPWSNNYINRYRGYWVYAPAPSTVNHLSTDGALAEQRALMLLYKRIRAHEEAFNMAPVLAEMNETIDMIVRPASALREGITKHLRSVQKLKGRWLRGVPFHKRRETLLRAAAGSWLEFSFGWAPTVSDVAAGAEALAKFVQDEHVGYKRISAQGSSVQSMDLGTSILWNGTLEEQRIRQSWETKRTVRYIVGHRSDVITNSKGDFVHFLANFGLTNWRNVAVGAWEIIPYSWLVDYFTNIGELIECWATPTNGVSWIVRTERQHTARRYAITHVGSKNVSWWRYVKFRNVQGGYVEARRSTVTRTIPTSLGYPHLEFETPFGSPKRMTNMLAVWKGMSGRILNSVGRPM